MGFSLSGSTGRLGRNADRNLRPAPARTGFAVLIAVLTVFLALLILAPASSVRADEPVADQEEAIAAALAPAKRDLADILERGMLRMAIPYNPLYFAYDGEKMIGFAVERARAFEEHLRKQHGKRVDVLLVPLPRDQILEALIEGSVDIAAANLTITPERAAHVDFSDPILSDVAELVVTGPSAPQVTSFDDLADVGLFLRPSSSYYGHLITLNEARRAQGLPEIPVREADERLEDYDLLDMLHAGSIPAIVVDHHKLELWVQVFENITVHEDLALNRGGEIAWALRQDSPELMASVNDFLKGMKEGTLIGNVLLNRYLGSSHWIETLRDEETRNTLRSVEPVIRRHAEAYGFDWRMILAQAFQESKLDHTQVSDAGAVGIMQVLPSTAADANVGIPDISSLDNNVHAGVKYLRFLRGRYFDKPKFSQLDEVLFSLATYNAGYGNIERARRMAQSMGLDPNVWFSNVEVAAARAISREPVTYVRNIYKYYVSLTLMELRDTEEAAAQTLQQEATLPVSASTEDEAAQPEPEQQAAPASEPVPESEPEPGPASAPSPEPGAAGQPEAEPQLQASQVAEVEASSQVAADRLNDLRKAEGRETSQAPRKAGSKDRDIPLSAYITLIAVAFAFFALFLFHWRRGRVA